MAGIFDAILALTRRKDPVEQMRSAIIADKTAKAAVPEPPVLPDAGGQPVPPQDPNAPAPPPQEPPVAEAYKSPPDLTQLYNELMTRDRNTTQIDQGMTLIAAGLARDENRDRIMSTYADDVAGQDSGIFESLRKMQETQQELAIKNQLRLALPQIAKQYGLSMEAVTMMFEQGTLEEFLNSSSQPSYETITMPDGSQRVIDRRKVSRDKTPAPAPAPAPVTLEPPSTDPDIVNGQTSPVVPDLPLQPVPGLDPAVTADIAPVYPGVEVAPAKPREIEMAEDGTGGKVAVYKDTRERVDGGGRLLVQPEERKITYTPGAKKGSQIAMDQDGNLVPEMDIPGVDELDVQKTADGRFQTINKTTGTAVGEPFGAPADASTDDMKEFAASKAAAEARGEKHADFDKWLNSREKSRSPNDSSNIDPKTGIEWPNPPTDHNYVRKADGSFDIGPNGVPKIAMMEGSKAAKESAAEEKAAQEKLASEEQDKNSLTVAAELGLGLLEDELDGSITDAVTGPTGLAASVWPGSPAAVFGEQMKTIKGILSFSRLQRMKQESLAAGGQGGALGNVSNIELQLLASTIASVAQNQDNKTLKRNLEYIRDIINDVPGAGRKYLDEIKEERRKKRAARAAKAGKPVEPDPLFPDEAAPVPTDGAPPAGAKLERWDPVLKKLVPVN